MKYPDTREGAIEYLRDESTLDLSGEITAKPDPSVQGVWRIVTQDHMYATVYLAGYRESFGNIREHNDFEVSNCNCPDCR
jgi:hypothetical protein